MRFDAAVVVAAAHVSGDVVPARAQMAATLGFHIILACLGIAFPTIVLLAEFIGLRRHDEIPMRLARRWSQAMGVLIAVGAVTGTVLSFEMGLLWPGLMRQYGAVLGFPFGVEGLFFFLEAIFTAIYLYGWRRLPGWAHFWSGMPIALSGILGAMSVIAVNSWMNQPGGFTEQGGRITSVNVWQVYFNHAAIYEMPHMILAAYMVTGFTVAGIYAAGILRGRRDPALLPVRGAAEVAEATRHRAHTWSAPFHQRAVSRHRFIFAAPLAARIVKSASPAAQAGAVGRSPA